MANKRPKPEEIVSKLRQVEVLMGQGLSRLDAIRVVSRMWWKLPSSALRACNVGSGQAARSRDIGTRG